MITVITWAGSGEENQRNVHWINHSIRLKALLSGMLFPASQCLLYLPLFSHHLCAGDLIPGASQLFWSGGLAEGLFDFARPPPQSCYSNCVVRAEGKHMVNDRCIYNWVSGWCGTIPKPQIAAPPPPPPSNVCWTYRPDHWITHSQSARRTFIGVRWTDMAFSCFAQCLH